MKQLNTRDFQKKFTPKYRSVFIFIKDDHSGQTLLEWLHMRLEARFFL